MDLRYALPALFMFMLGPMTAHAEVCEGFGPQSPRDIDRHFGQNAVNYGTAPQTEDMSLCNIHMHRNAEHRSSAYNVFAGHGDEKGIGGGYACQISKSLTKAELKKPRKNYCKGLNPGDTIEVHWVFTSCEAQPGPGLGACATPQCVNPTLRVEAQVYTLVNDPNATSFQDLALAKSRPGERSQPASLPTGTGEPVEYLGSTTGPKYTQSACSPYQVHWSVRPQCAKLDINSLSNWCADNVFEENAPHGVRKLVVHPDLLSPVK